MCATAICSIRRVAVIYRCLVDRVGQHWLLRGTDYKRCNKNLRGAAPQRRIAVRLQGVNAIVVKMNVSMNSREFFHPIPLLPLSRVDGVRSAGRILGAGIPLHEIIAMHPLLRDNTVHAEKIGELRLPSLLCLVLSLSAINY